MSGYTKEYFDTGAFCTTSPGQDPGQYPCTKWTWANLFNIIDYSADPNGSCVNYDKCTYIAPSPAIPGMPPVPPSAPTPSPFKRDLNYCTNLVSFPGTDPFVQPHLKVETKRLLKDDLKFASVRLESKEQFVTPGTLLIVKYSSIPGLDNDLAGPWPSLWTTDTSGAQQTADSESAAATVKFPNWPFHGEIDLIETAYGTKWGDTQNSRMLNHAAIHAQPGCVLQPKPSASSAGTACTIIADSPTSPQNGCVVNDFPPGGYDKKGIVALELGAVNASGAIDTTFWKCPYTASTVVFGAPPDLSKWEGAGCVASRYEMSAQGCFGGKSMAHNLIIDTAVGGGPFNKSNDPGTCATYQDPSFWELDRIAVWKMPTSS